MNKLGKFSSWLLNLADKQKTTTLILSLEAFLRATSYLKLGLSRGLHVYVVNYSDYLLTVLITFVQIVSCYNLLSFLRAYTSSNVLENLKNNGSLTYLMCLNYNVSINLFLKRNFLKRVVLSEIW